MQLRRWYAVQVGDLSHSLLLIQSMFLFMLHFVNRLSSVLKMLISLTLIDGQALFDMFPVMCVVLVLWFSGGFSAVAVAWLILSDSFTFTVLAPGHPAATQSPFHGTETYWTAMAPAFMPASVTPWPPNRHPIAHSPITLHSMFRSASQGCFSFDATFHHPPATQLPPNRPFTHLYH